MRTKLLWCGAGLEGLCDRVRRGRLRIQGVSGSFCVVQQRIQQRAGQWRVISGGQTGVDRAALDAALQAGWLVGGWCPLHRRAEDGKIPPVYPLKETPARSYAVRTEWNVRDSDGTLVLVLDEISSGTQLTISAAGRLGKPYRIEYLRGPRGDAVAGRLALADGEFPSLSERVAGVVQWLRREDIRVLNIAGPRGSSSPEVYPEARQFVVQLLQQWQAAVAEP